MGKKKEMTEEEKIAEQKKRERVEILLKRRREFTKSERKRVIGAVLAEAISVVGLATSIISEIKEPVGYKPFVIFGLGALVVANCGVLGSAIGDLGAKNYIFYEVEVIGRM